MLSLWSILSPQNDPLKRDRMLRRLSLTNDSAAWYEF